jgi:hypothetical protein
VQQVFLGMAGKNWGWCDCSINGETACRDADALLARATSFQARVHVT